MRRPLKIWQPDETEASACLLIQCYWTGKVMRWNDAARANWTWDYDEARKPYATTRYYSPEAQ